MAASFQAPPIFYDDKPDRVLTAADKAEIDFLNSLIGK